ncbi:MAG: hypothetical protein ACXWP6_20335 [Ktedonobacterales bacterium]
MPTTPNGPAVAVRAEPSPFYTRIARFIEFAPHFLLAVLLLVALVTVFTQAHRYGISIDEPLQQRYGVQVFAWYASLGKDTSFLTAFGSRLHMPEHGGIVDAFIAALQSRFVGTDTWLMRRIISGLIGWLGVVALALAGYELGGSWVAFAAALGLWLYPRYYGAMYNNPKDIPAAVGMTFVLWATLQLVNRWNDRARALRSSVLLGCCLGAATAVRVTALSWFGVLAVLLAGWWIINGKLVLRERRVAAVSRRQGAVAGTIAGTWLLSTMVLWPYILLNPIINLVHSIRIMVRYPWYSTELFNGTYYSGFGLPPSYVPTWLVIGSPPMLLVLALVGLAIALTEIVRTRRVNPAVATVIVALGLSLAPLVLLHPVLYDALRQFIYIIPLFIVLAAYGLVRSVTLLLRQERTALRWIAVAMVVITLASYVQVTAEMVALSPYEYTYFSPLVGGIRGASGKYETDYWGTCSTAAAGWLRQNYRQYTSTPKPTLAVSQYLWDLVTPSLPAAFQEDESNPDFFIAYTHERDDLRYSNYRVIHVVATEGVPLCVVKVNPAITKGP